MWTDTTQSTCTSAGEHGSCVGPPSFLRGSGTVYRQSKESVGGVSGSTAKAGQESRAPSPSVTVYHGVCETVQGTMTSAKF